MNIVLVLCLLPAVLAWGGGREGKGRDGGGTKRWESQDPEMHGAEKVAFMKMFGKIFMGKGGQRHGGDDGPMMRGRGDSSHEDEGRGMKPWHKRHGKDDGPMRGRRDDQDEEEHRMKKWHKRHSEDDGPMGGRGDDQDEEDHRMKKWHKRHSEDDGPMRGRRDDQDEEEHGMKKSHKRHGGWDEMGGYGMEDDDDDEMMMKHGRRGMMRGPKERGHGKRRGMREHGMMPHWGPPMIDENSSEEDIKRAYFRFFGKIAMKNVRKGMMKKSRHGDDDEDDKMDDKHKNKKRREWKNRHGDDDEDDHEMRDMDQMSKGQSSIKGLQIKLKMGMKTLYKADAHKFGKLITLTFLRLCECDGDDGTKLMRKLLDDAENEEHGKMANKAPQLPEIPDFGSNTTAKSEFIRNLTEEQRKMLFGYDLVKNMCEGAKRYLVKSKEFYEKYFPMTNDDDSNMMSTTEMP